MRQQKRKTLQEFYKCFTPSLIRVKARYKHVTIFTNLQIVEAYTMKDMNMVCNIVLKSIVSCLLLLYLENGAQFYSES